MRRLAQLCIADPTNTAAIRTALAAVNVFDLPTLQLNDGAGTGRAPVVGSLRDLLASITRVTTLTLFHNDSVDVTMFAVPPGAVLPLHDHPTMTVYHRLVRGRMHTIAFDWKDGGAAVPGPVGEREAAVFANEWREAGDKESSSEPETSGREQGDDVVTIQPQSGGVLHAFTAGDAEPAVFIDVISPSYFAAPDNIPCTYFDIDGAVMAQTVAADSYPATLDTLKVGDSVLLRPTGDAAPRMDYLSPARR